VLWLVVMVVAVGGVSDDEENIHEPDSPVNRLR